MTSNGSKVFSDDNVEYELTMYNKFIEYTDDEIVNKIFNFIENYPNNLDQISSVIKKYSNEISKHDKLTEDIVIDLIKHRYIDFIINGSYWDGCLIDICNRFGYNINIIKLLIDYLPETAINIIVSRVKYNKEICDYFINNDLIKNREYVIRNIISNSTIYTPDELIEAIDYYRSKGFNLRSTNRWDNPINTYIRSRRGHNLSLKVIKYICKYGKYKITKKIISKIVLSSVTNKSEILKILCKRLNKSNKFIFQFIENIVDARNYYEFEVDNIKIVIDMLYKDINYKMNNMNLLEFYIKYVEDINEAGGYNIELSEDFIKYLTDKGLKINNPDLLEKYLNK